MLRNIWISLTLIALRGSGLANAQDLNSLDLSYGLSMHGQVTASTTILPPSEVGATLRQVWTQLANTSSARNSPVPLTLFYLHSPAVQAFATGGGLLYVTDSFVQAVEGNAGIIAWALGHEMAHDLLQHGVQKYLRDLSEQQELARFQYRIDLGDKSAPWEQIAYAAAEKIASAKIDRDQELSADRIGLLIAAEAGYHPAYGILATRTLREKLGDQSKFGAFFSDHPRWTTREQRIEENYPEVVARFNQLWPNAELSPGGPGPNVAPELDARLQRDSIYEQGSELIKAGRYADAIQYLDDAIRQTSTAPLVASRLYAARGSAHGFLDQWGMAIQDYDTAIALNSRSSWAYLGRSNARAQLGDKKGSSADQKQYEQLMKRCRGNDYSNQCLWGQ